MLYCILQSVRQRTTDITNYVMCLKIIRGRARVSGPGAAGGQPALLLFSGYGVFDRYKPGREDVRCSSRVFTQRWLANFWKEGRAHPKVTTLGEQAQYKAEKKKKKKRRGRLTSPHPVVTLIIVDIYACQLPQIHICGV